MADICLALDLSIVGSPRGPLQLQARLTVGALSSQRDLMACHDWLTSLNAR